MLRTASHVVQRDGAAYRVADEGWNKLLDHSCSRRTKVTRPSLEIRV
jgi:hypothetical protein